MGLTALSVRLFFSLARLTLQPPKRTSYRPPPRCSPPAGGFVERIGEDRLRTHLLRLVGPRDIYAGFHGLEAAAEYIAGEFRAAGLAVREDPVRDGGRSFRNIHGTLVGADLGAPPVLIVAHYDAVPGSPGADDNASGVAALLEIARALAAARFRHPLLFLATTLEEYGYAGSRQVAARYRAEGRSLAGVLDLEMLGFTSKRQEAPLGIPAPGVGDFIAVVGNARSEFLVASYVEAAKTEVPDLPVETLVIDGNGQGLPLVRLSDHAAFWDQGFPAVMITDTAFLRNPHYHEATDTLATLDLAFLRRVAAATAATAARLAGPVP
jgi:hypothetical protein